MALRATPGVTGGAAVGIPGPDDLNAQADRLWDTLQRSGITWIPKETLRTWVVDSMKDGKITRDELKNLLGGRLGFFTRLIHPSQNAFVIDVTKEAWDQFFGGDSQSVEQLNGKIEESRLKAAIQGKGLPDIWGSHNIIPMDTLDAAEGVKSYLLEIVTERINNDTTIVDTPGMTAAAQKAVLIDRAKAYIESGDIKGMMANTDGAGNAPYLYLQGLDSQFVGLLEGAYGSTRSLSMEGNERVNFMYSLVLLNSLVGTGLNIKASYESARGFFDKSGYNSIRKIFETISHLRKEIDRLDEQIRKEEDRAFKDREVHNEAKLADLRRRVADAREMLALSLKFYRYASIFSHTSGSDQARALEDAARRLKPGVITMDNLEGITGVSNKALWDALLKAGYIDKDGRIQPKFDGVRGNFGLNDPALLQHENLLFALLKNAATSDMTLKHCLYLFANPEALRKMLAQRLEARPPKPQTGVLTPAGETPPAGAAPAAAGGVTSAAPQPAGNVAPAGTNVPKPLVEREQARLLGVFNAELAKGTTADLPCAGQALGDYVLFSITAAGGTAAGLENTTIMNKLATMSPENIAQVINAMTPDQRNQATQVLVALQKLDPGKFKAVMAEIEKVNPTLAADIKTRMEGLAALERGLAATRRGG